MSQVFDILHVYRSGSHQGNAIRHTSHAIESVAAQQNDAAWLSAPLLDAALLPQPHVIGAMPTQRPRRICHVLSALTVSTAPGSACCTAHGDSRHLSIFSGATPHRRPQLPQHRRSRPTSLIAVRPPNTFRQTIHEVCFDIGERPSFNVASFSSSMTRCRLLQCRLLSCRLLPCRLPSVNNAAFNVAAFTVANHRSVSTIPSSLPTTPVEARAERF